MAGLLSSSSSVRPINDLDIEQGAFHKMMEPFDPSEVKEEDEERNAGLAGEVTVEAGGAAAALEA